MPEQEFHLLPHEIAQNVADRQRAFINSLRRHINREDPQHSQWVVREQFKFWKQDSSNLHELVDVYQYLRPVSEAISQLTLRDVALFAWEEIQQVKATIEESAPGTQDYGEARLKLYRLHQIVPILTQASRT